MSTQAFGAWRSGLPGLSKLGEVGGASFWERANAFREILVEGNQSQNLSRLTAEADFFWGHLIDVWNLQESRFLESGSIALDLGSGCGVPGLLHAALFSAPIWYLCESEKRKAEFLRGAAQKLGISGARVQVYGDRVEKVLNLEEMAEIDRALTIVSRAVGKVTRIFDWIQRSSTWNKLILFKGPGWDQEWKEFLATKRGGLELARVWNYSSQSKGTPVERKLIELVRTE